MGHKKIEKAYKQLCSEYRSIAREYRGLIWEYRRAFKFMQRGKAGMFMSDPFEIPDDIFEGNGEDFGTSEEDAGECKARQKSAGISDEDLWSSEEEAGEWQARQKPAGLSEEDFGTSDEEEEADI